MSSDKIHRVFSEVIPEISAGVVEIKAVARQAGHRSKVAVASRDPDVDCIGACVGVRGSRIARIVELLNGERLDLVRWDESAERLIANALQPAEVEEVKLDPVDRRATVFVREDQDKLARGRRDWNRRLASELCGYEIEIETLRHAEE